MSKKLIEYDPLTKTQTWHEYDHASKKTRIATIQDCESIVEHNKKLINTPEYASHGKKQCFFHIGRVPNAVIIEWKEKHGVDVFNKDDLKKVERLLMSNEYKYLRTTDKI